MVTGKETRSGGSASVRNAADDSDKKQAARKPWKLKPQERKLCHNGGLPEQIEIFEGKPIFQTHSFLEVTSAETGYMRIRTGDGAEFLVPSKVVDCFQCMDVILHGDVMFRENFEKVIRFPDIKAQVMESILQFVFTEHLNIMKANKYWGHNMPRVVFQFEVDPGQVMDIIYAAHFLGIKNLLNVAATMVAHHLQDVPDISSMPTDLAWCVAEQFSAQELLDDEERSDFLSLDLDTELLWEKHCKKEFELDIVAPVLTTSPYPPYDGWVIGLGPPPPSWKSLFVALKLQRLADVQDGGRNEIFLKKVSYEGKHAYSHTIRPMSWEWVFMGENSLSFSLYAAQFPNLFSLSLNRLPLCKPAKDGRVACLSIGHVLDGLPLLQFLDISETGFTTQAAISLSKALQSHKRLQVLRAAFNEIKTEGFQAIAEVLPLVKTLRLLDVRENQIHHLICEAATLGLKKSHLSELFLDGNFRCEPEHNFSVRIFQSMGSDSPHLDTLPLADAKNVLMPVAMLGAMPQNLHVLSLRNCGITDIEMQTLLQALREHIFIESIDLTENSITSEAAIPIFTWLQGNSCMLELCLANNNISESSSTVISASLYLHPAIEKLSLRGNYTYGEDHLLEVIHAATARGEILMATKAKKFILDIRQTNISYLTRARLQRQIPDSSSLSLLI